VKVYAAGLFTNRKFLAASLPLREPEVVRLSLLAGHGVLWVQNAAPGTSDADVAVLAAKEERIF
jgi:hypothetical protein